MEETTRSTTANTGSQYEGSDIATGSQTPEGVTASTDVMEIGAGGDTDMNEEV